MNINIFRNIKPVLALTIMLLGFLYFFIVTVWEKQNDQVLIAVVALTSMAGQYYFGSSQNSNRKDDIISDLSKQDEKTI